MGLDLMSYLITPVQRVPRYVLLLTDLLRNTPESHPDFNKLSEALEMVKAVGQSINTGVASFQAKGKLVSIQQDLDISIV
jgi:hypothetical protein